ncbi:MAG TPA: HD domain-containing protein [Acidimicrobiia bacterium]|nr:HD domain-containing protein [Acidimicrobiia bacterium]
MVSRRRRLGLVCLLGLAAGAIVHFAGGSGDTAALACLAAGLVLGEILSLRLEDGAALPLSYAVLVVIAASFSARQYAIAVLSAELVSILLRITDRSRRWRLTIFAVRMAVAAATFIAYQAVWHLVGQREEVAAVLVSLAAAAAAQVLVDVTASKLFHLGASFTPRGRLAWLAIVSSGMLMAIGYRGVNGDGRLGVWGPLLFATPLLAAWYAFERLDTATRSYRQTIEALAMAPELGGMVPAGHSQRVAALASAMGEQLGLSADDVHALEMAALLHHVGQVTLDEPQNEHGADAAEVMAVTGAMLREIRPLVAAGEIVAGEVEEPKRRLAAQALRLASEYDDLTARDNVPGDLAVESLRSAPAYVYDERVVAALERVLGARVAAD